MSIKPISSFHDVISLWPAKAAMSEDLGVIDGKPAHVREWSVRGRIPRKWFDRVIEAATKRGFEGVTYQVLTDLFKSESKHVPAPASAPVNEAI